MGNLYASAKARSQPGGYLANRLGGTGVALAAPMSPTKAFNLATGQTPEEEHWFIHGTKILAAAPVDVVDTMAALIPGVERGSIDDAVYDTVGLPGYAQWVRENKGAVDVASGILGSVIIGAGAEIAVAKVVGSGWFAATGLGKATQLGQIVGNAQRAAAEATRAAAAAGVPLRWYQGQNLAYVGVKTAEMTAKAGVSELAIAAALNKNEAVWSDDWGTNLLFAGLGLGIGAGLGVIAARGAVNRWANSTEVAGEFAAHADPTQLERAYLQIPLGRVPSGSVPKISSEITSMYLNARTAEVVGGVTETGERAAIKVQTEAAAERVVQSLTVKGTPNLPESKFSIGTPDKRTPQGRQLVEALHEDPTTLYGAASLAAFPPEVKAKGMLGLIQDNIDKALMSRDKKRILAAKEQQKQIPLVLLDKVWMTVDEAEPLLDFDPALIQSKTTARDVKERTWLSPHSSARLTVREDGHLNVDWLKLDIQDMLGYAEVSNQVLESMIKSKAKITVPAKPTFMEIDYALEFEKRGGTVNWDDAGIKTTDEAGLRSLSLKYKALGRLSKDMSLDAHTRFKLNLPQASSIERAADPTGAVMLNILQAAGKGAQTLEQLKGIRSKAQQIFDFSSDVKTIDSLDGGIFGFNRSRESAKGQWMAPVLGMFNDTPAPTWTKFDLTESIAETKAIRQTSVMSNKKAPFASGLMKSVVPTPEARFAGDIAGMADNQVGGTAGRVSSAASQFVTQSHKFRNNRALLGAQTVRRVTNRITELQVDAVLKQLRPHIDNLSSVAGQKSKVLLNQYLSNTAGWDIAKTEVLDDGMIGLVLDHKSAQNVSNLGRKVEEGELLVNKATGKAIVLDGAANAARMDLEKAMHALLDERNAIRHAMGLEPIRKRAFFTPPAKASADRFIGFTLDAANRPVQGKAIVAKSQAEYDALVARMKANLEPGERIMTRDAIRQAANIWEEAKMDFIDPTAMAAPPGQQKGTLASYAVNPQAFDDALLYLKQGYEQVGNGVIHTLFDAQLKVAKIRGAAQVSARGATPGAKNIWQQYEETLLGIPGTRNPVGLASIAKQFDDFADSAIAAIWPSGAVSSLHMSDVLSKVPAAAKTLSASDAKSFESLADALGPYMPFKTTMDYAAYKHGIKPPPEMKDVARTMNRIGSGVILRWLELPHAMMNMAGIITNMPSITYAKNAPLMGRLKGMNVVDSTKIMARGMKRMFRDAKLNSADWAEMIRNGDVSQDVAELHMQMSLLKDKSSFMKFMTGDPKFSDYKNFTGSEKRSRMLRFKGLEGMASIVADTSEDWSRQISHFIGLELADYNGIHGLQARHNFARQIANDAIANYDPLNRPEIYQSAFGNMYGLFLSYAQNYYQRLFRWMEDGDYKSVGISLSTQAAMFGFLGLPGARQLSTLFESKEDKDGLVDGIYERFGPATGSVVANGGFNQLVTLFGLPSVSLHTRGDANLRTPALDFLTTMEIPTPIGLEVVKDVTYGLFEMAGQLVSQNPRAAAESLARNMPSRALRGAISVLFTEGQEADAYGNVISENKDIFEASYRILGLRSTRQQAQIEAYFANNKAMAMDAHRRDELRKSTKSLIRAGQFDRLPEVFQTYVDTGGQPANYASWIQGLIREANETRTENQLSKSLKSSAHQDLARRIQLWTGEQ